MIVKQKAKVLPNSKDIKIADRLFLRPHTIRSKVSIQMHLNTWKENIKFVQTHPPIVNAINDNHESSEISTKCR